MAKTRAQTELDAAQAFFLGLAGEVGTTFSQDTLRGFEPQLNAQGIELLVSGSGITQKIRLPSGEVVDVIGGATAGGGTGTLQFNPTGVSVDSPSGGQFPAGTVFGATSEGGASTVLGGDASAGPAPRTQGGGASFESNRRTGTGRTEVPPSRLNPAPRTRGGGASQLSNERRGIAGTKRNPFFTAPTSDPRGPAQALAAAIRQRQRARRGGRQGTIIGGFAPGRPETRPATLLGT